MVKHTFKYYFFIGLLLIIGHRAVANHVLGGEISYKYIGSQGDTQTYNVILTFIGDCSAVSVNMLVGPTPSIDIYKGDQFMSRPKLDYNVAQSGMEITPVCPDEKAMTSCVHPNNPIPGIRKFVYTGLIKLTDTSSNWRFIFRGDLGTTAAGRSIIIQNADPLGGISILRLEATLNNTVYTNSSTYFSSLPAPFFCAGKPQTYNLGAIDDDNDKLVFSLVPATTPDQGPAYHNITYIPPFTYDRPLPVLPSTFGFNQNTGQIDFVPTQVKNCLVVNLVEEYRNGIKVGSCMREMIFVIMDNCNNDVPQESIYNVQDALFNDNPTNPTFTICEGRITPLSFEIRANDPNGDNITISYGSLPPGATIDVIDNGTPKPVLYFSCNPSSISLGDYLFHITYADDGCTLESRKTVTYILQVVPYDGSFTTGYAGPCLGASNGLAWIMPELSPQNYQYIWTDSVDNVLRDVYSYNGDTLRDLSLGQYKVLSIADQGCKKTSLINVTNITETPNLPLPNDTTLCNDIAYRIITLEPSFVNYLWNTGDEGCCITITQPGRYTRTASNLCGSMEDSISVNYLKCNFCLFVPNAFSPNNDGNNDVFRILETCVMDDFKLQIFNRWGQLVFTSLTTSNSWDGWYKGQEAETGTYFYYIKANPSDKSKGMVELKGDIALIR